MEALIPDLEDGVQRLDSWMWCARLLKTRSACARHIADSGLRINRQITDKPHARLRPGDVLTFALVGGTVRVLRVLALATRRGPAAEARTLFEEILEDPPMGPPLHLPPREGGGISAPPAILGARTLGTGQ